MQRSFFSVIFAIVLALGMMGTGLILANGLIKFRTAGRYVTVKGLAEREVKSDSALWKLKVKVSGNNFKETSKSMTEKNLLVQNFLKRTGFSQEEIGTPSMRVIDLYTREFGNDKTPPVRYVIESQFILNSKNVDLVEKASAKTSELIDEGVILEQNEYDANPKYFFTQLNDVRPAILAEATESARKLAEQFAKDSNSKVGSIKSANQGVFHILDREAGDAGAMTDVVSIMKKIRVVSTIDYFLVD